MKNTYPVILTPDKTDFVVYVPDFDIYTQGHDLTDAIEMARDAISLCGVDMEDSHEALPEPSDISSISAEPQQLVTLVDVDFTEYRRKLEQRVVKKNCTLPSWLCYEAEKAHLNFSQLLQKAIKEELHLD